jgi:tetratricopeptide (TPR) repeat protein
MSAAQDNAGGPIAIRGYLVQTLVALLDIAQADPPFTEITLEPSHADEQFDFVWSNAHGTFAVQVKSTSNEFQKSDVESWAKKLEAARKNETCSLVLVGNYRTSLAQVDKVGAVSIKKKNLDLPGLIGEAAHLLAKFIETQNLDAGTADEREMIAHSLISKLLHYSTTRERLTRDAFIKLMTCWIKEAPFESKLHGKQCSELLNSFATDWLPNGPPVAILQGFPGCGKTQLASAIAANAPLSLDPIEPSPDAQDCSLDILMGLADALASEGITDLMDEFEKGADGDLFNALLKVLRRERILIVVDEFQRLFANRDTLPPVDWQHLIEKLNNSSHFVGRLLLISNRAVKKMRWCEKCDIQELKGLTDSEAAAFLADLLKSKNLTSKVPTERLEEICHRLDGNPRALITLAESLVYDSLEELLSLAPDLFNTGDVEINHDLVEDFERELIERTLSRMEGDLLKFMRWIAVHRRPFKKEAFSEFPNFDVPTQVLRKQLIDRFLLTNTPSGDTMHPLAREISVTRLRDETAEWKQAHNLAANYHFRHFKAIQMKGSERCITSYAELRHHLFEAGRISELYLASDSLAQFALSQIPKTTYSQVPTNVETLEERIALITALPEDRRPKGLEYHLALCLKHRNTGDDYQKALSHVRRAVGPNVYYAVWLLLIELEYSLNGVDAMLKAKDKALRYLGSGSNAFAVYHLCANLLGKDNRLDAAIDVLEKGISTPGVKCLSPLIGLCSSYMEQTGRFDDAIRILRKCIDTPSMPELWKVYAQCAKLMAKTNSSGEAAALLKKGLTVSGMTSLHHLYLLLAELMVIDKKNEDAIRLLKDGISDTRVIEKKDIYCLCAELLVKNNCVEEASALLENGISSKSINDPVPLYHKFAKIMEETGNTDGGIEFLKSAMSHPIVSLEPSIYLVCAKQLFHAKNIDDAIGVLKRGLLVSKMKDKDQLYKMCAELIERQGRLDDAIGILEKGIADESVLNHSYLYQTCAELMEKSGRLDDAIEILKKGISAPALANKVVLFQACAKLMKKADRTSEGIELIEKAIRLPGMSGLVILYRACAELKVNVGRQQDAIQLLYKAIDCPKIGNLASLYQLCAELLIATKQREKAISLLKRGMAAYPKDRNLKMCYEKAMERSSKGGV